MRGRPELVTTVPFPRRIAVPLLVGAEMPNMRATSGQGKGNSA